VGVNLDEIDFFLLFLPFLFFSHFSYSIFWREEVRADRRRAFLFFFFPSLPLSLFPVISMWRATADIFEIERGIAEMRLASWRLLFFFSPFFPPFLYCRPHLPGTTMEAPIEIRVCQAEARTAEPSFFFFFFSVSL